MKNFCVINWKTICAVTTFAIAASLVGCNPNRTSDNSGTTTTTTKEDTSTTREGGAKSGATSQQPGTAPSQQPGTAPSANPGQSSVDQSSGTMNSTSNQGSSS
jgi:hypothetical protein